MHVGGHTAQTYALVCPPVRMFTAFETDPYGEFRHSADQQKHAASRKLGAENKLGPDGRFVDGAAVEGRTVSASCERGDTG